MGWKRLFTLVAVLGLIALTSDIGKTQSKKPIVRLNYSGSIYATTSVVGVEKGFFDQEGLIMNATPESAGEIAMQALIGGSTDFAVGANVRPIQALARDLPVKVVALSSWGFAGYIIVPVKDTVTQSLEELKGKTIAVRVGSGRTTLRSKTSKRNKFPRLSKQAASMARLSGTPLRRSFWRRISAEPF